MVVGVGTEPGPACSPTPAPTSSSAAASRSNASLETAIPGVFAAGDVASHDHPVFGRIRVEHYDNAWKMGEAAANNVLGEQRVFDDPHWFWSDQWDTSIEMAGHAPHVGPHGGARIALGPVATARSCWTGGGCCAVVSMNWPRDVRRSFELIRTQVPVEERLVADPEVDLRTLVPARDGA